MAPRSTVTRGLCSVWRDGRGPMRCPAWLVASRVVGYLGGYATPRQAGRRVASSAVQLLSRRVSVGCGGVGVPFSCCPGRGAIDRTIVHASTDSVWQCRIWPWSEEVSAWPGTLVRAVAAAVGGVPGCGASGQAPKCRHGARRRLPSSARKGLVIYRNDALEELTWVVF